MMPPGCGSRSHPGGCGLGAPDERLDDLDTKHQSRDSNANGEQGQKLGQFTSQQTINNSTRPVNDLGQSRSDGIQQSDGSSLRLFLLL